MYDPSLGRFLQRDPIGYQAGTMNLYEHVYGAPTDFSDPSGLKCQDEYTIPENIKKAIEDAWARSFRPGGVVLEQGFLIVKTKAGRTEIRPLEPGTRTSITFPKPAEGETVVGTFHTHPYEKNKGEQEGVSFSGEDLGLFVSGKWGQVMYVTTGRCILALTVDDPQKCKKCNPALVEKLFKDIYTLERFTKTHPESVEAAVKAVVERCGLCYYKVCKDKTGTAPGGGGGATGATPPPPKSFWERLAEAMYEWGKAGYPGLQ